jgi:hypothetical protein
MEQPDHDRLNTLLGRMVGDLGAVASGALVVLGDRLGFYKAMRDGTRITAAELAKRTGTHERYVREWLAAQAASGYIDYDVGSDSFYLNPEQATVFADEDSPAAMVGAFEVLSTLQAAEEAGVASNTQFEVAQAKTYAGTYDLVAFFDCLHDMGDPSGAAAHVLQTLAPDGTWMIVEPFAHDQLSMNLNPVGRIYYSASTMICTPASLAQEVGLGLGAQAGELRLRQVVTAGGFTRFRRATETPFNMVFEARP